MNWRLFLRQRRQFVLYSLIGAIGASVDFLVYSALLLSSQAHYQAANVVGYACGGLVSFALNARFNFRTGDRLLLRFGWFCVAALLGWAASAGLLFVAIGHLAADPHAAKIATIVVVVLIQYEFNRRISFRRFGPLGDA